MGDYTSLPIDQIIDPSTDIQELAHQLFIVQMLKASHEMMLAAGNEPTRPRNLALDRAVNIRSPIGLRMGTASFLKY